MRGRVLGFAALSMISGSPAFAERPADVTGTLPPGAVAAKMGKRPSNDEVQRVFPLRAVKEGKDGRASMLCKVSTEGTLFACKVLDEDPPGYGFGAAILALAPNFTLQPATLNGKPIESEYRLSMRWVGVADMDSGDRGRVVSNAIWFEAPTAGDVRSARGGRPAGRTILRCRLVTDTGRLRDCAAASGVSDTWTVPAKALAPKFKTAPIPLSKKDANKAGPIYVDIPFTFTDGAQSGPLKGARVRAPEGVGPPPPFPAAARAAGHAKGRVVLDCRVGPNGVLDPCEVAEESPAGVGFGAVALQTVRGLGVNAWTEDGRPVDGTTFRLPLSFVDDQAASVPATPPAPSGA